MKLVSLFSGCGGLDLGFEKAGFDVVWANDNASGVWETYENNFPYTILEKRSISKISENEIPDDCVGIIGGPPCQSWSVAGKGRGFNDVRGKLFFDFIRVISAKKPLFFVAENVEGLLSKRNAESYKDILTLLKNAGDGYNLSVKVLNANDYSVAQNRKRVFFVGYAKILDKSFDFPTPLLEKPTVRDAIYDLRGSVSESVNNHSVDCAVLNHEYWKGSYSYIFMSRNRVLSWDEAAFTVQASGRQTSLHPDSPPMVKVAKDVRKFITGKEDLYRRLSIRECARLQSFPDDFIFSYDYLEQGYKMVGNSVPVSLANNIAKAVFKDISLYLDSYSIDSTRKSIKIA